MATELRHYVTPLYPGAFFPEHGKAIRVDAPSTVAVLAALEGDDLWFAAEVSSQRFERFVSDSGDEKWIAQGKSEKRRVYVGTVYDLNEMRQLPGDYHILISNMQSNGWDRVVHARAGNWQPIESGDDVVSPFFKLSA